MGCYSTLKQKYPEKYYLFTSQREESSEAVSQVLDIFRLFASKFKRDLNPEPHWVAATRPTSIIGSNSQGIPALQGRGTRVGAGQPETEKPRSAPSSQVPVWSLCAWGDPALPSDQNYFCPCQENMTSEPWRKGMSNIVYKIQSEEPQWAFIHWAGGEMGKGDTFLEKKEKTGETTAYIQTRKAWTPRYSSGQALPSNAFTSTHRKPSECHVQSLQSKTREAQTSELETSYKKQAPLEEQRETLGRLWKTSLFSTATKAIRKANIPLLPLPGEWSCPVTVFRAAKASLLVVEWAPPHLTIWQPACHVVCNFAHAGQTGH